MAAKITHLEAPENSGLRACTGEPIDGPDLMLDPRAYPDGTVVFCEACNLLIRKA